MTPPRDLVRSDSIEMTEFSAPADAGRSSEQVDCGWWFFPRFNTYLEKFATSKIFVLILSVCGFYHGLFLSYFRSTSQVWGKHYNIEEKTVDWLIYLNEFLVGIFALFVSYYGNKTHRPKWIGATTIFLAIAGFLMAVPEIYKPFNQEENDLDIIKGSSLCKDTLHKSINDTTKAEVHVVAIVLIVVFLMVLSITTISCVSHGISYIDDNVSKEHSPGLIVAALACYEFGKYLGIYLSWVSTYTTGQQNVFLGSVWLVIIFLTFLFGSIMTLFPKILPKKLMKNISDNILNLASGNAIEEVPISEDGLLTTLARLLTNGIYLMNIFANVFLQSAIISFNIFEDFYNQAKFLLSNKKDSSGYSDPVIMQYTTNLLKEPFICCCLIITGLVITKAKPKARTLFMWNIAIMVIFILSFVSTRFLSCDRHLDSELEGIISTPYCAAHCYCSKSELFNPVCIDGKTFFSPCLAGCTGKSNISSNTVGYMNCSCGNGSNAIEGACSRDNCNSLFAISQVNSIITTGLLSTITVANVLIILRSVNSKDKATAIGLQSALLGIMPYLPVRIIYGNIIDLYCQYRNEDNGECRYYSAHLADFLASATIIGVIIAIVITAFLVWLIPDLKLYKTCDNSRGNSSEEFKEFLERNSDHGSVNTSTQTVGDRTEASVSNDYDSFLLYETTS